jgi:hypothetical protein
MLKNYIPLIWITVVIQIMAILMLIIFLYHVYRYSRIPKEAHQEAGYDLFWQGRDVS